MIRVDRGKISFIENHLFENPIEDFEGILNRYNAYEVELFIHVVSDPTCGYEKGVGGNRILKAISNLSAKERFVSLIRNMTINASPKGFYANKTKDQEIHPEEIKSVSFAYCNRAEVKQHFEARNSEYGIIFFHDFLQNNGIIPVRYINEEDDESIRKLVFNEAYALEAYGKRYDMRWENEWRINHNVDFDVSDIAFLIVPDAEYGEFVNLAYEEDLEYYILPSSVFTNPLEFFLNAHAMEHHSWNQIRLHGEWKVDFDMFPDFSQDERAQFMELCGDHLECLVKAEIQDVYERRYVSKFINFAKSLNEEFLEKTSFKQLETVAANAGEPYQTHRDLMMHCYTKRFEIQKPRIDLL